MKYLIILACVVAVVVANEKYSSKYDNIDVDEILTNERLLEAYFKCLMDRGKCTPEGTELKGHVKDAIETGCASCTKAQEAGATKVIEHLIKHKLEYWRQLCDKYDHDGKWRKEYEERAKAKGIVIPK